MNAVREKPYQMEEEVNPSVIGAGHLSRREGDVDFPRHDGDTFYRGDGGWGGLAVKDDAESPFEHRMAVAPARGEDSDSAPRPAGLDHHQTTPVAQHRDWGENEGGWGEIHRNTREDEGRRGRHLVASGDRRRECGGGEEVETLCGQPV